MLRTAWLNLWRNPRRTCTTAASVCFAVFFCILLNSAYIGIWEAFIQNFLRIEKGHIEICHKAEEESDDEYMPMSDEMLQHLSDLSGVTDVLPRIETFAMASAGDLSRGVAVFGVRPSQEKHRMSITSMLTEGSYLEEDDDGVLLGLKLSRSLNVGVGDSIAVIGKGCHGSSAGGLFPIRGIVTLPVAKADKVAVYMSLKAAQEFIGLPVGYSRVYLWIDKEENLAAIQKEAEALLPPDEYDVQNWISTMSDFLIYAETTKTIGEIVNLILYMLVASGVLGTVIMMVNERRYEFGMMIALGMQRTRLALTVFCELLFIMVGGGMAGIVAVLPIIHYFECNPFPLDGNSAKLIQDYITNPEFTCHTGVGLIAEQLIAVALIGGIVMLYPALAIFKLKVNLVLKQ